MGEERGRRGGEEKERRDGGVDLERKGGKVPTIWKVEYLEELCWIVRLLSVSEWEKESETQVVVMVRTGEERGGGRVTWDEE